MKPSERIKKYIEEYKAQKENKINYIEHPRVKIDCNWSWRRKCKQLELIIKIFKINELEKIKQRKVWQKWNELAKLDNP